MLRAQLFYPHQYRSTNNHIASGFTKTNPTWIPNPQSPIPNRLTPNRWAKTVGLLALATTLTMCNKDVQETAPELPGISEEVTKIQGFVAQAANPVREKDLEYYTQEQAQFILEGALNYGQIDPEAKAGELKFDEFTDQVSFAEEKVTEQELLDAFNRTNQNFLAQPMHEGYLMLAADVVTKPVGGSLAITITRISGKEPQGLAGPPVQTSFSSNYRNRTNAPSCNPANVAADYAIMYRINSAIGVQTNDYILTDVETWHVNGCTVLGFPNASPEVTLDLDNHIIPATYYPNPNDPDGIDPWAFDAYNDYRTYLRAMTVTGSPVFDSEPSCLTPAALTYLTQNAWDLIGTVKNDFVTSNVVPIAVRVTGHRVVGPQIGPPQDFRWSFAHNIAFIYGRWQYTGPRN